MLKDFTPTEQGSTAAPNPSYGVPAGFFEGAEGEEAPNRWSSKPKAAAGATTDVHTAGGQGQGLGAKNLEQVERGVEGDESSDYSSDGGGRGTAGQDFHQPVGFLSTMMKVATRRRKLREASRGVGRTFVSEKLYTRPVDRSENPKREAAKEAPRVVQDSRERVKERRKDPSVEAAKREAARKEAEEREAAESAARAKAHQDELARHAADNEARISSLRESMNSMEEVEAEKKRILKLYKFHSYLAMKNHLKSHEVPVKEVDSCTGKYELVKLAEKHSVEIPDDPKALKRTRRPSPTRLKISEPPPIAPPARP